MKKEYSTVTKPGVKKIFNAVLIGAVGALMGAVAFWPNGEWSPAWGNFFGALIVAAGGLAGCLHAAKLANEWIVPWTWSLIVVGGFVIAGASLQVAVYPGR